MSALAKKRLAARSLADWRCVACRRRVTAGRAAAPSGEPARHGRVGGEGTRLAQGAGATPFFRFFASRFTPSFFVASVVAPPDSLMDETTIKNGH